jgi:arsenite methyltransferase
LPTQFAKIKPGDTVVDLGSGAGNDCFVARHEAGPEGRIIGIDFTESMIEKAESNAEKLGYENVEFLQGDIEDIPLPIISSVVISNCVLNLVPDKQKVFSEIFRILKPGGHFSISDIVLSGELPAELQKDAEMYAGCVSGAVQKEVYLNLIQEKGFENLTIQKEKPIILPQKLLSRYLNEEEISQFYDGSTGIYSITVYAEKPALEYQNKFRSPNEFDKII